MLSTLRLHTGQCKKVELIGPAAVFREVGSASSPAHGFEWPAGSGEFGATSPWYHKLLCGFVAIVPVVALRVTKTTSVLSAIPWATVTIIGECGVASPDVAKFARGDVVTRCATRA